MADIKRFYKEASVAPAASGQGFNVLLDGRPVRTPQRAELEVPSEALAQAIAAEWSAQDEHVRPEKMPVMSIACAAIDLVPNRREAVVEEMMPFAQTDTLCYRVERPADLAARQEAIWQPLLDWLRGVTGAELTVCRSVWATPQSDSALEAVRRTVERHSDLELAALGTAVKAAGSMTVGLALAARRISAEEAFAAAELESTYQIELWGEDAEATKRREGLMADLKAAEKVFDLGDRSR